MRRIVLGLALAWLAEAAAQEIPDALVVLHKVADVYTNANRYHLAGEAKITVTRQSDGSIVSQDSHAFIVAMQKPDKVHVEMTPAAGEQAVCIISNGEHAWAYSPTPNEYMTLNVAQGSPRPVRESDVTENNLVIYALQLAQQTAMAFGRLHSVQQRPAIVRQEAVTVGGSSVDCYVIVIQAMPSPKSTTTWWVDRRRNLVLREEVRNETGALQETVDTTYTTAKVDEPVSDELFVFTPPPKARLVKDLRH